MNNRTEKKVKVKGPIRTGAVVPFLIFTTLVVVFTIFFLDLSLKKSFEFVGTKVNGAEVNVASVETSFKNLSIEIKKVQFTNKENPTHNTFEIGKIRFSMEWDALLRAKILINEVAVNEILILTKRTHTGFVVPPPPPEKQEEESQKMKEMLGKTQEEFKGNIFGDIAGVLGGKSTNVEGGAEGELKSKEKLDALQASLKTKEKDLSAKLSNLPGDKEMKDLQLRFDKIDWNGLSNLQKAPKIVKEIDTLKKDVDKTIAAYNNANKAVNDHIKEINNATKEIPKFVDEDIKSIEKRLKIPSIDTKSIAQMLFGNEILKKLELFQEYQGKIKKYLPPKKDKSQKETVKVHTRELGENYKFGRPNSYPLFWIKNISIDSKNDQGIVAGKITDITNNQVHINKATVLKIDGDFPGLEIRNVKISGKFDHRSGAHDNLKMDIGSYPVTDKALSDTDDIKFIIRKSDANTVINADFVNDNIEFKVDNYFRKIEYDNSAKSPMMDSVLKGVAESTDTISLRASAKGRLNNLKWDIKSNLADAIQNTVKKQIQAKIDATKQKIKEDVERQIAGQKAAIEKQINDAKSQYEKQIAQGQKQLNDFKSKIDSQKKSAEKSGKKNLEKQGKDLLKKIKF